MYGFEEERWPKKVSKNEWFRRMVAKSSRKYANFLEPNPTVDMLYHYRLQKKRCMVLKKKSGQTKVSTK